MKIVLVLFALLLNFSLNAQVVGEGRFYATDDDSLSFIKSQLHYQATRDVLSKEIKAMGLDEQLFWRKYDERFNDYFKSIAEQIKQKYADEKGEVPREKKADFERALRARRLTVLSRYGRIQSILSSFSVKRMTRSPQVPQSRFYQIEAKTDRRAVNELFLKFTTDESLSRYKTLFVSINFILNRMNWNDVGVEIGSDFTDVVKNHWRKWLEEKLADRVDEVVFADESTDRQLRDFLMIPRDLVFNQKIENGDSSFARFSSSLWLKVDISLEKLHDDLLLSKRELSVEGDLLLLDLKTNKSIYQAELLKEKKTFHTEEARSFSSSVASLVYGKPLEFFESAKKSLGDVSRQKSDYSLSVGALSSVQDLFDVSNLLVSKGVVFQAKTDVTGFDGKTGQLSLTFRGNRQELGKFLMGLAGQSVGEGKVLQVNPKAPTEMMIIMVEPPPTSKTNKTSGQG